MTVLHVQVESPISNRLNQLLWRVLLFATRPLPPRQRDSALGWGVPLLIASVLGTWSAAFVVGFALIYVPFVHDPGFFRLADRSLATTAIGDALYFSAVSFFTIGYGDVTPVHPLTRLAAVVQGAAGLVTITLSLTYLLSVYPLITRKTALATSLNQELAGRPDALAVAERYVAPGRFDLYGERLRTLNDELIYLGEAHGFYPVLYFVRPREIHRSFVRTLALVQGLVLTLRYGIDGEIKDDPRLLVLEEGLLATLHALGTSSLLASDAVKGPPPDEVAADFQRLLDELRGIGLPTPEHPSAGDAYRRLRAATDPYIRAYAHNLGYTPGAVWAVYDRWQRDTALVSKADVEASAR